MRLTHWVLLVLALVTLWARASAQVEDVEEEEEVVADEPTGPAGGFGAPGEQPAMSEEQEVSGNARAALPVAMRPHTRAGAARAREPAAGAGAPHSRRTSQSFSAPAPLVVASRAAARAAPRAWMPW
jgi:hypothetical protein